MKKSPNLNKVTLIMMVKNEGKNIGALLESIFKQTKLPEEIIVINNNSNDDTVKIISSFKDKRVRIIDYSGDLGSGRNLAITEAKHNIIACTDGGCILDPRWLEEITSPFVDSKVDVVGGVFKPLYKNFFEQCEGAIVCKKIEDINEKTFLPSSRSFAFRKEAWKSVGGYPKHNIGGEDTLYVLRLKEKGCNVLINKRALVYWRMRSPLKNFLRQFYLYAIGDVKNENIKKMKINLSFALSLPVYLLLLINLLFFNPFLSLVFAMPAIIYLIIGGIKVAIETNKLKGFLYGILLLASKRIAYVCGVWREWIFPYKGVYKNENIKL